MPLASAKVTSKGQITLPAKLRALLGVKPGDRLDFERTEDGGVAIVPRSHRLEDLRGMLPSKGRPLSDAEIVAMVDEARTEIGENCMRQYESRLR